MHQQAWQCQLRHKPAGTDFSRRILTTGIDEDHQASLVHRFRQVRRQLVPDQHSPIVLQNGCRNLPGGVLGLRVSDSMQSPFAGLVFSL